MSESVPTFPRKTAAITGAAGGIGRAFCAALARQGFDLILLDHASGPVTELAARLNAEFEGMTALACVADLTQPEDLDRAAALVKQCATLELLINGAGFGSYGTFIETDYAVQLKMMQLHVIATVRLCRVALPGMVARGAGGVINIASISAFTRFPEISIYGPSKLFLVGFTECLQVELHKIGASRVRVQALCPGQTRTPFTETAGMRSFDSSRVPWFMWMSAEHLVELSLKALARRSGTFIPLWRNRLFCFVFGNPLVTRPLCFLRKLGVLEAILRFLRR